MLTESLGKTIVNAQDEIRALREQLNLYTQKNVSQDSSEISTIYNRLQYLIEKFEFSLTVNVDKVLQQVMGKTENQTVQKLPKIQRDQIFYLNPQNLKQHKRVLSSDSYQNTKEKPKTPSHKYDNKGYGALQKQFLTQEQISPYLQNVINEVNHSKSFVNFAQKKSTYKKRVIKHGRISKPAHYIPPEIRNNPFADSIPIKESEINQGIYNLINKGMVPKDVDILPAFERGIPAFINRQANIYGFNEKQQKHDINLVNPNDYNNIKVDIRPSFIRQRTVSNQVPSTKKVEQSQSYVPYVAIDNKQKLNQSIDVAETKLDPRNYPEVLDTYSLHHFMIRKGKTVEESPEFTSFKRSYNSIWGQIQMIIKEIEKLAQQYNQKLFYVDGKKIVKLTEKMKKPTLEELVNCIVEQNEIRKLLKLPQVLKDEDKYIKSATKIQALIRMFLRHREYQRVKQMINKVKLIQTQGRLYLKKKETKLRIREKNEKSYQEFMQLSEKFKQDWKEIKNKKRVEIHINSFSYDELKRLTMNKQLQRENTQITRIFNVKNPDLTIIYICPYGLSDDITSYYYKILELGEIEQYRDRLFFIKPENCEKFPSHFSLAKKLLYSPKAIKRIKSIIKNKHAYIVPGYPSNDDIRLSLCFKIPLLSGEPQKQFLHTSKASSKRLIQSLNIPTPIGALEIYDETEFINTLTVLIANNKEVNTWILKIDDEFQGRGIAYINIDSILPLYDVLHKSQVIDQHLILSIKNILTAQMKSKLIMVMPTLYRDYKEFLMHFTKRGGIIEAMCSQRQGQSQIKSPSVSIFIHPDGPYDIIFAFEKIQGNQFINVACNFPQTSLNFQNQEFKLTIQKIADKLYHNGIYGYITLDFIVLHQQENPQNNKYYFIGMDCFLNQYTCSYFYFDYLVGGQLDNSLQVYNTNVYDSVNLTTKKKVICQQSRSYFYCPFIHHPGLQNIQIKNFFQMCRLESISFDLEKKYGSSFILVDILQTCVLGLLTISENSKSSLNLLNQTLNFLIKQAGQVNNKDLELTVGDSRIDNINIRDIISRVRILTKKMEIIEEDVKQNSQNDIEKFEKFEQK